MAHVAPIYPNFARGEVSPLMFGRIDIEQYPSCLDKCRNVYIRPYGCASRISGTEFVSNAKNNGKARLLKFVFSATDSYIIECGAGYFRFYQNGGAVIKDDAEAWVTDTNYSIGAYVKEDDLIYYCLVAHTAGTFSTDLANGYWVQQDIYEVPNDYVEEQLDSIQYIQIDDIIKLTCLPVNGDNSTARPKELIRKASDDWTFRNVEFKETPYLDQNTSSITLTPSAVTGNSITITASSSYFESGMVGANFWIGTKVKDSDSNKDVQGYVKITAVNSATSATAKVMSKLSGTTATKIWGEGAFSDYRGWPAVVALFDGRLYYARTPHQPRNVYGSKPYAYETFTPAVDNEDDAGINVELATNANGDGSDIKWMIGASYLLCGTYGGEFIIRSTSDGAITPTDITARQRTNWGGEPIQPIVAGTFIHFIQRSGNKLRQFQYDYYYDAYKAVDVSIFSEHLLASPIKQMALQKNPDSIIYLMREDGNVVMLTLEQDQSVQAWSLLEDLSAKVESIQTIPSYSGNYDEVYFLMLRQGLATVLTYTCSNADLTVTNVYNETKSEIGVIENTLTSNLLRYNVNPANSVTLSSAGILSGFNKSPVAYAYAAKANSNRYYFSPSSKAWEWVYAVKTGSNVSTTQFIVSSTTKSYSQEINIRSSKFSVGLTKDGTSNFATITGTHTVTANTDYLVRLKFNGSRYDLEYSTDDGSNWIADGHYNSTTKIYGGLNIILGADYNGSKFVSPFLGTIDLNKSYIKIDNIVTWSGLNTYWTNKNGETVNTIDYGLSVSGIPQVGDTIDLTYTTSQESPLRYIERIKYPLTSENRDDWWYLRAGLEYNAYELTGGCNLTLSASSGDITITASESIFSNSDVDKRIRAIDSKGNVIGEGVITAYTSATSIEVTTSKAFSNLYLQGGLWGMSVTSVSGFNHLLNKDVQVFADGYEVKTVRNTDGSITLDNPSFRVLAGLPYQSYITTMPMEAGSQNGTAVGKRKRISEMAIRVWNSIGVKVGRDLNNLYDTIYKQEEPFTGVIPNIKYNQGWVWDANITVEQSHPYPMNILSIAPIVTEVDK